VYYTVLFPSLQLAQSVLNWLLPADGITVGLVSLLLQYLLPASWSPDISPGESAPRRWKRVVRLVSVVHVPRALLIAVVIGLNYAPSDTLSYGLSFGLHVGLINWLSSGLSIGLIFGVIYGLISLALSAQMGNIHLTERMRWTWRSLRRGLFNSRHLCVSVLLTCTSMLFIGLRNALQNLLEYTQLFNLSGALNYAQIFSLGNGLGHMQNNALIFMTSNTPIVITSLTPSLAVSEGLGNALNTALSIGLSYWLLLGLIQGTSQDRIDDQDRIVPNQGIYRSFRNSIVIGVIGGAMIGSIEILSSGLSYQLGNTLRMGLEDGLSYALSHLHVYESGFISPSQGILVGMSGTVLICILTGGLATFRHYTIRSLLSRSHTFAGRASQFLDDSCARILLRRVGGGYSFIHRLLLDHLADAAKQSTAQTTTSTATRSEEVTS
jgi:hypothetical protein